MLKLGSSANQQVPHVLQVAHVLVTYPASGDMKLHLINGYDHLKYHNSTTISVSIDFGCLLNTAFNLHVHEKMVGHVKMSWKAWIESHVGIKDSYVRTLRIVSDLLKDFPRFRQLGLTFSELYQRRKEIDIMLREHAHISLYWSEQNEMEHSTSTH